MMIIHMLTVFLTCKCLHQCLRYPDLAGSGQHQAVSLHCWQHCHCHLTQQWPSSTLLVLHVSPVRQGWARTCCAVLFWASCRMFMWTN